MGRRGSSALGGPSAFHLGGLLHFRPGGSACGTLRLLRALACLAQDPGASAFAALMFFCAICSKESGAVFLALCIALLMLLRLPRQEILRWCGALGARHRRQPCPPAHGGADSAASGDSRLLGGPADYCVARLCRVRGLLSRRCIFTWSGMFCRSGTGIPPPRCGSPRTWSS